MLESVPVQGHAFSVKRHYIEADGRVWSDDLHVVGREPAKSRPFTRVDGRERGAEAPSRPVFDLDEDDSFAVAADQVDLAARQADVTPYHAIAGRLEETRGALLAGTAFAAVTARQARHRKRVAPRERATRPRDGTAKGHAA